MPQNNLYSKLRRFAWRAAPAPLLNLVFGEKLRGMGAIIEQAKIVGSSPVTVPDVTEPCFRIDLADGTKIISNAPLPNNVKLTHTVRQKLGLGPDFAKALIDLVVRYSYPHAMVPVLTIPVPDRQRGGFHLQHRNLPQESDDFSEEERALLREIFTPQSGWSILDIGCYLGHGTTHLAQIVGPNGRVLAVEAIPNNARMAANQLAENGLSQASVLNRAIWKVAGETIAMNTTENQANAIADDVISSAKKIDITTTSIAELTTMLGKAADLVSLTVNGAEVEALDSLDEMPADMRPWRMVMPGWYPTDDSPRSDILKVKLEKLGYKLLITKHRFVMAWRV